jgi:hypothetical protein
MAAIVAVLASNDVDASALEIICDHRIETSSDTRDPCR